MSASMAAGAGFSRGDPLTRIARGRALATRLVGYVLAFLGRHCSILHTVRQAFSCSPRLESDMPSFKRLSIAFAESLP